MLVFHVTTMAAYERIQSQGLIPVIGPRAIKANESIPAVYCFTSESAMQDALANWLGDALDEDESLAILAIDLPEHLPRSSAVEYEVAVHARIEPRAIYAVVFD